MKISTELEIFFSAVFSGIFLFSVYFAVEMIRNLRSHPLWLINLEDVAYWSVAFGYLFVQIYHTNDGIIRGYYVLGLVLGAVISWKSFRILGEKWKKFVHSRKKKRLDK